MKIGTIVVSIFLTWVAFDKDVFRRQAGPLSHSGTIHTVSTNPLRQRKRIYQRSTAVIPPWHRRTKKVVRSKCNHFSVKSRDVRDSDQRKIRRRFNNM